MDSEAVAIAVAILILIGELAWCVSIIGGQHRRIRELEDELAEMEGEVRWQLATNRLLAAIALALGPEEEKDPADWWKEN